MRIADAHQLALKYRTAADQLAWLAFLPHIPAQQPPRQHHRSHRGAAPARYKAQHVPGGCAYAPVAEYGVKRWRGDVLNAAGLG